MLWSSATTLLFTTFQYYIGLAVFTVGYNLEKWHFMEHLQYINVVILHCTFFPVSRAPYILVQDLIKDNSKLDFLFWQFLLAFLQDISLDILRVIDLPIHK